MPAPDFRKLRGASMTTDAIQEPEVLFARSGHAGIITLNRPKALNALSHTMVRLIWPQMLAWKDDPAVRHVIIEAAGPKAFCAGGDIRQLHDLGKEGRQAEARAFWREEYTLNHLLKTYPKPVIALINGIVMGGGVGMSFHGSHRIATETLMFAMPEVGIGFFPDVGASYILPRLADHMGRYLALTGARVGLGDALALGLVTHGVAAADLPALRAALIEARDVDAAIATVSQLRPEAPLLAQAAIIREAFGGDSLCDIFQRLAHMAIGGNSFASDTLEGMRKKSPTSMAIALEQMRRGAAMDFAAVMQMEYRIVSRIAEGHDFYEGVRAVIIDKDHAPKWLPDHIEFLDAARIARHFEPLADDLNL
jgi:enoyl-CoA hydratase